MSFDLNALIAYVTEESVVDTVAEAWLILSNPADGDGKGNVDVSSLEQAYISDDWSKVARRIVRGFAEANERPDRWPWRDPRFDRFRWRA